MPLKEKDQLKLEEMQRLCMQVEDDAGQLRDFLQLLAESQSRHAKLVKLYEKDWLRIVDSAALTASQRRRIEAMVPKGRHSILGEDTIWNALSDLHEGQLQLLKALAKLI